MKFQCQKLAKYILKALITFCSYILLLSTSVTAGDSQHFIATGFGLVSGDFGSDIRSELQFIDLTVGYLSNTSYTSVNIPFNQLSASSNGTEEQEEGVGDITLRGDKELFSSANDFFVNGTIIVKLPTADKKSGLGSGEFDYGGYLTLNKTISDYHLSIASGILRITDTSDQNYNNPFLYGAAVSKSFGKVQIGVSVEGGTPLINDLKSSLKFNINTLYNINNNYSVTANALKGLSDGSPDYGYSIGIIKWF